MSRPLTRLCLSLPCSPLLCCRFKQSPEGEASVGSVQRALLPSLPHPAPPPVSPSSRKGGPSGLKGSSVPGQVGVLCGLGGAPQEMEAWRTTPRQLLKGAPAWGCRRSLGTMTPWLLPLLLLLLAGPPAVRPVPPTCYSRMLGLSREITGDFQSLQAMEPSVSPLRLPGPGVQCRPRS